MKQVKAIVKGAASHIGKWAKASGYCGDVELQAVPALGEDPTLMQTYSCHGGKGDSKKRIKVKRLCCR